MHPLGLIENQLDTSSVVIGFYLVIALLFAIPTYDEGRTSREGGRMAETGEMGAMSSSARMRIWDR